MSLTYNAEVSIFLSPPLLIHIIMVNINNIKIYFFLGLTMDAKFTINIDTTITIDYR